jgi:hypothetical protein
MVSYSVHALVQDQVTVESTSVVVPGGRLERFLVTVRPYATLQSSGVTFRFPGESCILRRVCLYGVVPCTLTDNRASFRVVATDLHIALFEDVWDSSDDWGAADVCVIRRLVMQMRDFPKCSPVLGQPTRLVFTDSWESDMPSGLLQMHPSMRLRLRYVPSFIDSDPGVPPGFGFSDIIAQSFVEFYVPSG